MMTAVRLVGKQRLDVTRVAVPEISDDEILLRVRSGFICGTDLRMYKNGHAHTEASGGLTLGHEIAGEIAAVGRSVTRYREGMRVTVDPNMGCGVCNVCVSGNTQMCPDLRALGIHIDGGFADYVRVPREAVMQGNVALIPGNVSFDEAALAEPLSCVLNAAERCETRPGDAVLIIGAGPIGLMHARIQRLFGAGLILVHDLNQQRLQACREREPTFVTVGPKELDQAVAEHTGGRGVDICITAAPSAAAQKRGLELLALNGRLMLFGGLPADSQEVLFNSNLIHYRQLIVSGTTRQNLRQYRACIDFIARGIVSVSDIITHRFSLTDAQQAFDGVAAGFGLKQGFTVDAQ
ncbi:MAG: Zn-dependent alcohol dehydrogenase [Spirochaetaceae bacterium]|nr:MAG: Zn-dependent alcohol dehydrogenase [Spirochaetaceae bacterium]